LPLPGQRAGLLGPAWRGVQRGAVCGWGRGGPGGRLVLGSLESAAREKSGPVRARAGESRPDGRAALRRRYGPGSVLGAPVLVPGGGGVVVGPSGVLCRHDRLGPRVRRHGGRVHEHGRELGGRPVADSHSSAGAALGLGECFLCGCRARSAGCAVLAWGASRADHRPGRAKTAATPTASCDRRSASRLADWSSSDRTKSIISVVSPSVLLPQLPSLPASSLTPPAHFSPARDAAIPRMVRTRKRCRCRLLFFW